MDRNSPFTKYLHETQGHAEVAMHSHSNGQLNYVREGTMHLLSPEAHWIVPWQRIVWIPPDQLHSVQCKNLVGSWKAMIPRRYSEFLPEKISILKTDPLLLAALDALPITDEIISQTRFELIIELIGQELTTISSDEFSITLPISYDLKKVTDILLGTPEDNRIIDDWAKIAGMSRRTFTRRFSRETGCSFGEWKKNMRLSKALTLLAEGKNVSEIADQLGYTYPSAFIAAFKRKYGTSPLKFKKGNIGSRKTAL